MNGFNEAPNLGNVVTVKTLLSDKSIAIPSYQRPYKWTEKNLKAGLAVLGNISVGVPSNG